MKPAVRALKSGLATVAITALANGCASRGHYAAPTAAAPAAFKENANWKTAQPADAAIRGTWWEVFGDRELNGLEEQIAVSNQMLKGVAAQYEQARAFLRGTRSGLFPQVDADPSISRARQSGNRAASAFHSTYSDFLVPASASYEPDVWGRVRRSIEASRCH